MSFDSSNQHGETALARKVSRMGMLIHRYYDEQAHRKGALGDPTRGQGRVLALLKAKPTTTQRELSYLLDMRQQSLSELLAKLEEKGYVTREKSAEDGRVTVVALTEAGAAAAPSPDQMNDHNDVLDCLDDDERAQLDALTDKVCASLEGKLKEMGVDPQQRPQRDHGPRGPRGDRDHGPRGDRDRGPHGGHGHGQQRGPWHDDRDQHGQRPYRDRDDRPRGYGQNRGPKGPYRPDDRDDHRMHRA